MSKVLPICSIENRPYEVSVLIGAEEELVRRRELRTTYETNRDIKIWSSFFLLKRMAHESSQLQHWIRQRSLILSFLGCNENTFRRHLKEMVRLKLATVDAAYNITLTSFKTAAAILGIAFSGVTKISYNPTIYEGKQVFRFLLVAREMKNRQEAQLSALIFHLDKNPTLKIDILLLLHKHGADEGLLGTDHRYFQERLLQLQMQLFKLGSDILGHIFTHRADINRSVKKIQQHHGYKSASSVSYLKGIMKKAGVISVQKKPPVISDLRSRLYVPDAEKGRRPGYKWLGKAKKTALFLTDQITFNHEKNNDGREVAAAKNAA